MPEHERCSDFALSVHARHDGTLEAAYIKLRDVEVAWTKELKPSVLLLDVGHDTLPVGIEILAPVSVAEVMELADTLDELHRTSFRRFLHDYVPASLVHS